MKIIFLKYKSIEFSKKSIAETFIITTEYKGIDVIVGYFALSHKIIKIQKDIFKGRTKNRLLRFAQFDETTNNYLISLPLIGQLSKNYFSNYNQLISGNQLLKLACEKVKEAQEIIGGRFVFLECEDNIKLKDFYKSNGFRQFNGKRLDKNKVERDSGEELIQMLSDLS